MILGEVGEINKMGGDESLCKVQLGWPGQQSSGAQDDAMKEKMR